MIVDLKNTVIEYDCGCQRLEPAAPLLCPLHKCVIVDRYEENEEYCEFLKQYSKVYKSLEQENDIRAVAYWGWCRGVEYSKKKQNT